MIINKLPPDIQHRVFELQISAGNKPNTEIDLCAKKHEGNFDWHATPEDWRFWKHINSGNFEHFAEAHPNGVKDPRVNISDVATLILKDSPIVLSDHSYDAMHEHIVKVLTSII